MAVFDFMGEATIVRRKIKGYGWVKFIPARIGAVGRGDIEEIADRVCENPRVLAHAGLRPVRYHFVDTEFGPSVATLKVSTGVVQVVGVTAD